MNTDSISNEQFINKKNTIDLGEKKAKKEESRENYRNNHNARKKHTAYDFFKFKFNSENRESAENSDETVNSNAKETSTCPSKLKKRRYSKDRHSRSCSSNSSYHNRKKHNKERRRKSSSRSKRHKEINSRSRDRQKHRSRSRRKSHSRDRRRSPRPKKSRNKSKNRYSRYPNSSCSSSSISTDKKKDYFIERRKGRERSRSNSALRIMKMKNLENTCGYFQRFYQRPHEDNDPKKPALYWDGYQWVIRPSSLTDNSFDIIKPGRKVIIANVPLHLNIQVEDFKNYLINNVLEKNIISKREVKEIGNIVKAIEFDLNNNTAVVAMESTEIAKRMVLLDGLILLGHTLRFSPYADPNSNETASNISKALALANSAQLSAKSNALAYAALQSLSGKNETIQIVLKEKHTKNVAMLSSRVIKIMNICDIKQVKLYDKEKFDTILDDMKEEFSKFGKIIESLIIMPKMEKIGAECGSVFLKYEDNKSAENAVKGMKDKRYEEREIKLGFIDESAYYNDIISS